MPESKIRRFRREAVALAELTWPMIIINLSYLGMRFTDTVFAGRLSPEDLAGVSVGGDVWMPITLFIMGILIAVSPTIAHEYGAGRTDAIASTVRQALWLAVIVSLPGCVLLAHADVLMRLIGVTPDVIPLAAGYADAIAWGLPAIAMFYALRFTGEAVSHTRPLLLVAIAGLLVNVFADWVLMYGKFGLPALGAVGTGYASAIVQWAMLLVLFGFVRNERRFRAFGIFTKFEWPRWKPIRALVALGFPIAVAIFMEGSLFSATGLLMATLGTTIVAGHQIAGNWAGLMFMVPLGIAGGITVRVGQALGRGDPEQARYSGLVGVFVCVGFMAVSACAMIVFRDVIVGLYTSNPAVTAMAMSLLWMAAAFQLFDGLQVAVSGVLRGYKDTRVPMLMTLVAYWVIGFPTAWFGGIVFDFGPAAVWLGLIAGLLSAGIMLSWRFWKKYGR
ncbi:MAG TPA: MATE family efflux transporter [Gammaproteobacteria bacterium]